MITICCIQVHQVFPLVPGWEVEMGFYDISRLKPAGHKRWWKASKKDLYQEYKDRNWPSCINISEQKTWTLF